MARQTYLGIIGNGETCALISPTGSIDWLCLPTFDGKIVFSKALSGTGDSFYIQVVDGEEAMLPKKGTQHYVNDTNILVTRIEYENLDMEIFDFMPWKGISESIKEKRVVYRMIKLLNKTKDKRRIRVSAGTDKLGVLESGKVYSDKGYAFAVYFDKNSAELEANSESQLKLIFVYGETGIEVGRSLNRSKRASVERELEKAKEFWLNWIARGRSVEFFNEEYNEVYRRSLLVCKLLTFPRTGSILAAPTASFPATPGGGENWDYRFCWIRDSYFVGRALLKTGHYEEVEDFLDFAYSTQGRDGSWQPIYTIHGKKLRKEIVIETETDIIRIGNAARKQLQLDNEGSILHLTYLYYYHTKEKDIIRKYWSKINKAADWIVKNYKRPENGIWELREKEHKKRAQWTYGKVMCYVGLESAIRMSRILNKTPEKKWERARDALRNDIIVKSWSKQRKAFLQTYDDDAQVDISVLAIVDHGLMNPLYPKIRSTAKLLESKLVVKGLGVKRFEDATLPFYMPTLWMASYMFKSGNSEKAAKYLEACIRSTTELYLAAEHFDPISGEQHGNFPQAFNHSMFIEVLLGMKERDYRIEVLNMLTAPLKIIGEITKKLK